MILDMHLIVKNFNKLKWKPRINFEKGLKETINWYYNNKSFLSQISKKVMKKELD